MAAKCPSCKLLFPDHAYVPAHLRDGLKCRPSPVKREAVPA